MASQVIKFYRKSSVPTSGGVMGGIYYVKSSTDSTVDGIYVCTNAAGTTFERYGNVYTHPSISATGATSTSSVKHGGTFTAIDSVTVNSQGHVTAYNTKTVTVAEHTIDNGTAESGKYISAIAIDSSDKNKFTVTKASLPTLSCTTGTAETNKYVSSISVSGHTITVVKAALPSGSGSVAGSTTTFVKSVSLSGHTLSGDTQAADTDVSTGSGIPTSAAVKSYVDSKISSAIHYKGEVYPDGTSGQSTLPTSGVSVGDAYSAKTDGTYTGHVCEAGDLIIAIATTPTWTVVQNNLTVATASKLGTIKIGYTQSDKNYPVVLNDSNQAYVNVPWEDTHHTAKLTITANGTTILDYDQATAKTLALAAGDNVTFTAGIGTLIIAAKDTHYTATHTITGDSGTATTFAQSANKTTKIAGGTAISTAATDGVVTINHGSVTCTPATDSATLSHSDTFTAITSATVNSQGHVTGYNTRTYTLPAQYSLPTASTSTKGGIKIGSALEMNGEVCNVVWAEF